MPTKAELQAEVERLRQVLEQYQAPDKHRLVSYVDGKWTFQSPMFPIFAATMAQMLTSMDAKNYIEIDASDDTVGPMVVTIQKRWGQTPHQLRVAAESKAEEMRKAMLEVEEALEDILAQRWLDNRHPGPVEIAGSALKALHESAAFRFSAPQ